MQCYLITDTRLSLTIIPAATRSQVYNDPVMVELLEKLAAAATNKRAESPTSVTQTPSASAAAGGEDGLADLLEADDSYVEAEEAVAEAESHLREAAAAAAAASSDLFDMLNPVPGSPPPSSPPRQQRAPAAAAPVVPHAVAVFSPLPAGTPNVTPHPSPTKKQKVL